MILGIGNDIQLIKRVQEAVEKNERFVETILTQPERDELSQRKGEHYWDYLAGRFSAKEAYAKATGLGLGGQVHWQGISILNNEKGAPILSVTTDLQNEAVEQILVTISHSEDYVISTVIIEGAAK